MAANVFMGMFDWQKSLYIPVVNVNFFHKHDVHIYSWAFFLYTNVLHSKR